MSTKQESIPDLSLTDLETGPDSSDEKSPSTPVPIVPSELELSKASEFTFVHILFHSRHGS